MTQNRNYKPPMSERKEEPAYGPQGPDTKYGLPMRADTKPGIARNVYDLGHDVDAALQHNEPGLAAMLLDNAPKDIKKDGLYAALAMYIADGLDALDVDDQKHTEVRKIGEQLLAYAKSQCAYFSKKK